MSPRMMNERKIKLYDPWLIGVMLTILVFGLLMMTSASIVISEQQTGQPFYFLFKQLVYLILGFFLGFIIFYLPIQFWQKQSGYLLVGVMTLLALVLIHGIGHSINGSMRWLGVGGLGFQVSELAKLISVIFFAGYFVRRQDELALGWEAFLKPMLVLAVIALLLLREPDFGATVVVCATVLGMMFLAGMPLAPFIALFSSLVAAFAVLAISAPYRMARLTAFLNPWARPYDTGYQLTQSLIAFGRGGLTGVGLGNSLQKMSYLPEAHTDFLFAVIAEELGALGIAFVMFLFLLLTMRIFFIGRQAQRLGKHFSGFVSYGLGLWVAIQFIVSLGVNSGLLPTKGLTLPLMSYGGSSLLVNCLAMALMIRIDYENRCTLSGIREG